MNSIQLVLLILMLLAALWAIVVPSLLKAAIGLAVTSVLLTLLMFQMDSPLAAVFELSVCAGLITVVFVSTISMTKRLSREEEKARAKARWMRFALLPVLLIAVGTLLWGMLPAGLSSPPRLPAAEADVRTVLWNLRRMDLVGQIVMILAGVFGVVVLFKEQVKTGGDGK